MKNTEKKTEVVALFFFSDVVSCGARKQTAVQPQTKFPRRS
jgi:sulfur relay (sulfurtransferase) complex TusBCD TusD component (DsrE family)